LEPGALAIATLWLLRILEELPQAQTFLMAMTGRPRAPPNALTMFCGIGPLSSVRASPNNAALVAAVRTTWASTTSEVPGREQLTVTGDGRQVLRHRLE